MSLAKDKTSDLWRSFIPLKQQIQNRIGEGFVSMQVYDKGTTFYNFTENTEFDRWAAAEVGVFGEKTEGLEPYIVEGGLYAVFTYRGTAFESSGFYKYIYEEWMPASIYEADAREHFELLPPGYRPDDPNAEEKVFVPVRIKS